MTADDDGSPGWVPPAGPPAAEPPVPPTPAPERPAPPPGPTQPLPRYGQYAPGYGPAGPSAPPAPGAGPAAPAAGAERPAGPPAAGYGPGPVGYGPGPGYGPAPVGYGPGAGYGPPPGAATPYGWQPPVVQPGIVPLRPLGLGEILDGAFRAVRANPRVMFGLSAIVAVVTVGLGALVTWYIATVVSGATADVFSGYGTPATDLQGTLAASSGLLVSTLLQAVATTVLTGLLVVSVSRSVIGQTVDLGGALRAAGVRVLWVLGFTALLWIVQAAAVGLLAAVLIPLVRAQSWTAVAAVGLAGGLVLVVGFVWLAVRTLLVTPALILEGGRFWPTVARAWRLTRGSFWRLLGIYLLTQIIVGIVASFLTVPAVAIATLVAGGSTTSFVAIAIESVAQAIALTLTISFSAAVVSLLYIDVRMRREGLDVELARAAQG